MERETREKYGVRDKKKKKGWGKEGWGGETLHEGIERNTRVFFLFLFNFFQFTSCFNSGRSRAESSGKKKKRKKRFPHPLRQHSWRGQTSSTAGKDQSDSFVDSIQSTKGKKKKKYCCKKKKRTIKGQNAKAKRETASLWHLTQWTLQRSHCKVAFMCWDRTTRRKTRLKGRRVQQKTRWLTRDLFVFSANRMRRPSPVNVFVPDRKPRR